MASPRCGCRGTITVSSGERIDQRAVRLGQDVLLARMGRRRHHDGAAARHRHQALELGGIGRRCGDIEFQIAGGDDIAAAERGETLGIDAGLGQADVEPAEQRRDRPETRRQRGNERGDIRPLIKTIGSRRAALDRIRLGHRSDSMNSASVGRQ